MSDLVGNPEDRFSRVAAHFMVTLYGYFIYCKANKNIGLEAEVFVFFLPHTMKEKLKRTLKHYEFIL